MKYQHILQALLYEPWALKDDYYRLMCQIVMNRSLGIPATGDEIEAAVRNRREAPPNRNGAVAVLPLYGLISQRAGMMSEMSGGTSTEEFGAVYQQLMTDPAISAVVIDIDSPGGSVFGIQELWDTMMSHRGRKPVTAVANSMAASAAYWIASVADAISVTPGGVVGSIGVISQHDDMSAAMERQGVKTTLITAGKHKADGNPFEPLSDQARASQQVKVDAYYSMFVGAVARGRGVNPTVVRNGYGEGDVVMAQDARRLGMVDRIETLDSAIARIAGTAGSNAAGRAAAAMPIPELVASEQTEGVAALVEAAAINRLLERRRGLIFS